MRCISCRMSNFPTTTWCRASFLMPKPARSGRTSACEDPHSHPPIHRAGVDAVWTSSPAVAGSVQKGNPPALTASAGANQSTGRSLKHPGLGSTIIRDRSSAVTSISPVSAVVPDRDGPRPSLRADFDRLHAGNTQTLSVDQSPDYRHYKTGRVVVNHV